MKCILFRLASSLLVFPLILGTAHAALTGATTTTPAQPYVPPQTVNVCQATNLQICGESFGAPLAVIGSLETFTMPDRFVANSVTFQCISDGYHVYYKVADNTVATCALKTCNPGHVSVCGTKVIPVPQQASVGDAARVDIPDALLAKNNPLPAPSLLVRCETQEGAAQYEYEDEGNLSCNIFACQGVQLSACGSTVTVPGPADLGTTLQVKTYDNRSVTVQCMGTEGLAPEFKVVDQNCN
jgi:hypothetical protein